MKLARFDFFVSRLSSDGEVARYCRDRQAYRKFSGKWYDRMNAELADATLIADLEKTLTHSVNFWRKSGSKEVFCRLLALDATIVVGRFALSPKEATQRRFSETIETTLVNSSNEFRANHDGLTDLLNRVGFEREVSSSLQPGPVQNLGIDPSSDVGATPQVGMGFLAMDLDHFKQVNDTFGHQYGDVVLACFAWRLELIAREIESTTNVRLVVARPGGEEFSAFVRNVSSEQVLVDVAEKIRMAIEKEILPSEEEWAALRSNLTAEDFALPHASERKISVSIGATWFGESGGQAGQNQQGLLGKLTRESDIALYKAKNDGRNCVRSFKDILQNLGRVIEHHPETGLVAIDIGSTVGVAVGNEFLAYHPTFTGKVPFVTTDGRTRKNIGVYPKLIVGRITVIDVQRELSFCKVLDCKLTLQVFPAGTRLEYVALGSITHLIDAASLSGSGLLTFAELSEAMEKARATSGLKTTAIAMAPRNLPRILEKFGVARVNDAMAAACDSVRKVFGINTDITLINSGEILVHSRFPANFDEGARWGKIQDLREATKRFFSFSLGIAHSDNLPKNLKQENRMDFARIALQSALNSPDDEETEIALFGEGIFSTRLQQWRKAGKHEEGLADYARFVEYGFLSASLENMAGLCLLEKNVREPVSASEHFGVAIQLEPGNEVYGLNCAYALNEAREYQRAFAEFKLRLKLDKLTVHINYLRSAIDTFASLSESSLDIDYLRQAFAALSKLPDIQNNPNYMMRIARSIAVLDNRQKS